MKLYEITYATYKGSKPSKENEVEKTVTLWAYTMDHAKELFSRKYWAGLIKKIDRL